MNNLLTAQSDYPVVSMGEKYGETFKKESLKENVRFFSTYM